MADSENRCDARVGDAAAQYQLGLQCLLGTGVERDYAQALQWFDQAALQEVSQPLYGLLQLPLQWFRNAAIQGDAVAQYYLGMMYCHGEQVQNAYPLVGWHMRGTHQGESVGLDYAQAMEWFRKSALQGEGRAQLALGWMYAEGKGVEKNAAQAQQYYAEADARGLASLGRQDYAQATARRSTQTTEALVEVSREGHGGGQDDFQILHQLYSAAAWDNHPLYSAIWEMRRPLQWYLDAAEQGHPVAQYFLGLMYYEGIHIDWDDAGQVRSINVQDDEELAMGWFLKAATQGHADAQNEVGWMYCYGAGGVRQDYIQALYWLDKAAAQGCVISDDVSVLARLRAARQVTEMARTGDATAQYSLGLIYYQGCIGETDADDELGNCYDTNKGEALVWIGEAAAQGHAKAQYSMGMFHYTGVNHAGFDYIQRDIDAARKWFGKAAARGSAAAQDMLNWFVAAEQIQRDAQAGKAVAQSELGFMYLQGRYVEQDYAQALAWFHKAAAQGDAAAYFGLGEMHVATDRQQALVWFSKSARQGYVKAQSKLGEVYRSDKAYAEAWQWYRRAAAEGDADAMLALGWMHNWGEGVPQDKVLAMRWFEKAADCGHEKAQAICKNRCSFR